MDSSKTSTAEAHARENRKLRKKDVDPMSGMDAKQPNTVVRLTVDPDRSRLDSWKEIAVYLGREVRTAQRWQKTEGLPVHRHFHAKASTVYAFKHEVDGWLVLRRRVPFRLPPNGEHRAHVTPTAAGPISTRSRRWLAAHEAKAFRELKDPEFKAFAKMDRAPRPLQLLKDHKTRSSLDRHDLEVARDVQNASLPQKPPAIQGLSCTSFYEPARTVGGDYYDFLPLRDGAWGIAIGDVSGSGIGAALVMASLQASVRAQTLYAPHKIEALMRNVNKLVCKSSPEHFFASLFYAEYQPASRILKYVNAGHNPPIVLRGSPDRREVVPLNAGFIPVGMFEDSEYSSRIFRLEVGDVLVAYTDGITESENLNGDPLGQERLGGILYGCDGRDPQEILQHILDELWAHSAGCRQRDDVTLLVMQVQAQPVGCCAERKCRLA